MAHKRKPDLLWVVEGIVQILDERVKTKFVVAAPSSEQALEKILYLTREYKVITDDQELKWTLDQIEVKQVPHNVYLVEGFDKFEDSP